MREVVIFGVGSPLVVDFEASLHRAGISVVAAFKNYPGEDFLLEKSKLVGLESLVQFIQYPFAVPLFTPANRQGAARDALERGLRKPLSLIDPTVPSLYQTRYQPGLYINAGCTIGAACELGEFVLINRGASLGHHARVGAFVSIGPGAVIAGQVTIEIGAVVGAGAVVLPKIKIGANSVVAAGSVVNKDVPAHCMVAGNPARVMKRDITGLGGAALAD
jgi:sugar O-acyltransferase (sialic acid O-acetyltransferase NeuD family)